jgi:hypothetical protein
MVTIPYGIRKGSFASSSQYQQAFSYKDLPFGIKNLYAYYPELVQSLEFVKAAWNNSSKHTYEFRIIASRIADALFKCLSYIEKEVLGEDNVTEFDIEQQVFFSKSVALMYELQIAMKISSTNTSLMAKGDIGSFTISFDADALSCLDLIESWDPLSEYITEGNDNPFFDVKSVLRRLLYGTIIIKAG